MARTRILACLLLPALAGCAAGPGRPATPPAPAASGGAPTIMLTAPSAAVNAAEQAGLLYEQAVRQYREFAYEEARKSLGLALELDPGLEDARDLKKHLDALFAEPPAGQLLESRAIGPLTDLVEEEIIRIQDILAEAQDRYLDKDFPAALDRLRLAKERLALFPPDAEVAGLRRRIDQLIMDTIQRDYEQMEAAMDQQHAAARARRDEERKRRQAAAAP